MGIVYPMNIDIPLPSGNLLQFAIEHGPVEIVNFPINSMVIFHSYVSLPEGIPLISLNIPLIPPWGWYLPLICH